MVLALGITTIRRAVAGADGSSVLMTTISAGI
jgi:hypothetical protein